jgi:hypothetical protein
MASSRGVLRLETWETIPFIDTPMLDQPSAKEQPFVRVGELAKRSQVVLELQERQAVRLMGREALRQKR